VLVEHFLGVLSAEMKIDRPVMGDRAMSMLQRYAYPGNVRELQNILERACLMNDGGEIEPSHLSLDLPPSEQEGATGEGDRAGQVSALAAGERDMIVRALGLSGWNQTRAARSLGVSRDNLRYRIKKYGITKGK